MAKFIWDKKAKKGKGDWVPAEKYSAGARSAGLQIIHDIQSFVSPVDGSVVGSRRQLREHNRVNDVVDRREYAGHKFQRAQLPSVANDLAQVMRERS